MTIQFGAPWLLGLLLLVPVLAALPRWAGVHTRAATLRYAHNPLVALPGGSWRLYLQPTLRGLRLLTLALVIIALARPQTGEAGQIIEGEGVDIALALDMSGSMASLDFEPQTRLGAAKQVISDFIDQRTYDRIGLVVFASQAFIQSPPTIDHEVLQLLLNQVRLAPDMGIEDGTAIGLGLASAANMLRASTSESKVIILLTDGSNNTGNIDPLTAALAIKALGIKVYTIGAGRPGPVPVLQRTGFQTPIVHFESELDEDSLTEIATTTGGRYFRAEDTSGLEQIYEAINSMEKSKIETRLFTRFRELAAWPLSAALALFLLELFLRNTVLRRIP